MIEGIEILNKTEIMTVPGWFITLLVIAILVGCVCFGMFMRSSNWDLVWTIIFGIGSLVSIIVFICLCIFSDNVKEPTGRYHYEAIVDDSVSFTELYERYDIIEQRGEIWVLKDKE